MKTENFKRSIDDLETDLLVVTLFEDERPPKGVMGLIDWRLNGFVSRLILSERVRGVEGESVLLPLHRRLPARRLLIVGLGMPKKFFLAKARYVAHDLTKVIKQLRTTDVTLSIPAASDERSSGDTERAVFDVFQQAGFSDELLLRWLAPTVTNFVATPWTSPAKLRHL